jgi:hypothetical protein
MMRLWGKTLYPIFAAVAFAMTGPTAKGDTPGTLLNFSTLTGGTVGVQLNGLQTVTSGNISANLSSSLPDSLTTALGGVSVINSCTIALSQSGAAQAFSTLAAQVTIYPNNYPCVLDIQAYDKGSNLINDISTNLTWSPNVTPVFGILLANPSICAKTSSIVITVSPTSGNQNTSLSFTLNSFSVLSTPMSPPSAPTNLRVISPIPAPQ